MASFFLINLIHPTSIINCINLKHTTMKGEVEKQKKRVEKRKEGSRKEKRSKVNYR